MTKMYESEIYHEIIEIINRYMLEAKLRIYLREASDIEIERLKKRLKHELKPYKADITKTLVSQGQTELLRELNLK